MKNKSMAINALLNTLLSILNLIFPLITFPYVARVLNVEGVGKYNFANSFNSYFLMLAALGIGTYAIREGAKYRDSRVEESQFVSEIFTINIITTIFSYVILFLCMMFIPSLKPYTYIITIFSFQIIFTTIGVDWIYSIFEDYAYRTVRSIVFKIISIGLLFIFVRTSEDYINYALVTVFSNVGSNLVNYFHAKKFCDIKLTKKINLRRHLMPILIIFGYNVSIMIFVNSDITILGIMQNDYIVGIYSVSTKIYSIVKNGLAAALIVTIPRLAMLYGKGLHGKYQKLFTKIFNVLLILVLPAMVGLFVMSKNIILIISGSNYIRANSSLKILSIALIFSIFAWLFNDCVLIPAKKEKITLMAATLSAVINILLNVLLISKWSENAAAFSTVVAELIGAVFSGYFSAKITNLKEIVKVNDMVSVVVGCVIIYIECLVILNMFQGILCQLVFAVALSMVSYVVILVLLKNTYALIFMAEVIKKLKIHR